MRKIIALASASFLLTACAQTSPTPNPTQNSSVSPAPSPTSQPATSSANTEEAMNTTQATIKTAKGDIIIKLYPDKAPNTVKNFITKAQSGYYTNLTFHRVEDWVIQGGDPLGTGTGGGKMATELNDASFKKGSIGVARGGDIKISNDSQFFICKDDCSWLTGQYTNFGEVIQGMGVVEKIAIGDKITEIKLQ